MELKELLELRGIEYRKTNNPLEILISCTSGEHEDNTPSLSFNLEKNIFHCWSCGFSGGTTKFLESIGEVTRLPVESKQPYKIQKLKSKIQQLVECDEIKLPTERRMFTKQFKGISLKTLKEFQAFTTQQLQLQNYICFPVYQFGKLKYIEGRLMISSATQSKYYRRPQHASTMEILFPLDKVKNTNYIILVEGIFDLLNMWQNLAPTFHTKAKTSTATIEHELLLGHLMTTDAGQNLDPDFFKDSGPSAAHFDNQNNKRVKWLIFKVKQRAETNYFKTVFAVDNESAGTLDFLSDPWGGHNHEVSKPTPEYFDENQRPRYSYNWPYDFFSMVEMVKLESEIEFNDKDTPIQKKGGT